MLDKGPLSSARSESIERAWQTNPCSSLRSGEPIPKAGRRARRPSPQGGEPGSTWEKRATAVGHSWRERRSCRPIVIHGGEPRRLRPHLEQPGDCSGEQFIDRLDQPRNVDVYRIPQDAMVDQVIAVDEVISCARDILPGNVTPTLLEFIW